MNRFAPFLLLTLSIPLLVSLSRREASPAHGGNSLEAIYAPFDSLRTDREDYSWPTDEGLRITSAFADFRDDHFHGGIDISTNGRLGYPVFASRDGYIVRVQISPYGYGKMVHVRHADGFTTTYNHLSAFNEPIAHIVRDQQYANERYGVNLTFAPNQLLVQKGQLIAFTGNTGVGDAHLHFEIRDESMNPVDPLLFPVIRDHTPDTRAPEFRKLAAEPMNVLSEVNGERQKRIWNVRRTAPGVFETPEPLHLMGTVGLSIKAGDLIDKPNYDNRVTECDLLVDGVRVFELRSHRIPDAQSKQIALAYDWPLWRMGNGFFQKLFVEEGNRLPFYGRAPFGTGLIDCNNFTEGEHRLEIVAGDAHGNRSRLIVIADFKHDATFGSVEPNRKGEKQGEASIVPAVFTKFGHADRLENEPPPAYVILDPARSSNTSLSLKKQFVRDYLNVEVASSLPFTMRPTVWVTQGEKRELVDLTARRAERYTGSVRLSGESTALLRLDAHADVNGSREVRAFDESAVYPILPDRGGILTSRDGVFSLKFGPQSVYSPFMCRIEKTSTGYDAFPQDVLLDRGAVVEYVVPAQATDTRVGLFALNGSGWTLLDWNQDGKTTLSATVDRFLSEYALLKDETPPNISRVRAQYKNGILSIRFNVRDNLAGVVSSTIKVYVDDNLIIGEYDPYQRSVKFEEAYALQQGRHAIAIQASDRMKNTAAFKSSLTVR